MTAASDRNARRNPVIDFHAHILDEAVAAACEPHSVRGGFGARPQPLARAVADRVVKPEVQLADMDARGVDLSLLFHSTVHEPTAWADPELADRLVRKANDTMAHWVGFAPQRYVGSLMLPLQDLKASLRELRRATSELGLVAVQLPASVRGEYLGQPSFWPLWEAIEALDICTLIHPEGVEDPWFQKFRLWSSLGQSIDEAKVMTSLICEGTLDRFPRLKIVMAHGGGFLPHYTGRIDKSVKLPGGADIKHLPSDYLRRFHYDTCVYDPIALRNLIDRVGVDRVVLGSDYPFGEMDPLAWVRNTQKLSEPDLALIATENARRLLGSGQKGAVDG